jgi:hypothetical protein
MYSCHPIHQQPIDPYMLDYHRSYPHTRVPAKYYSLGTTDLGGFLGLLAVPFALGIGAYFLLWAASKPKSRRKSRRRKKRR